MEPRREKVALIHLCLSCTHTEAYFESFASYVQEETNQLECTVVCMGMLESCCINNCGTSYIFVGSEPDNLSLRSFAWKRKRCETLFERPVLRQGAMIAS